MRLTTLAACAAVLACAAPPAGARDLAPARWGSYSVELLDEAGRALPTFEHRGRTYVLGALGARYQVRVTNGSPRRVEVVVSVDGRDVVDGRPSEWAKRGYLVEPYGAATIDGYRLSQDAVAAFRFSSVPRSYAALSGDARDVGVVGVAVFREREVARAPRPEEGRLRAAPAPAAPGAAPRADAAERPGLGTAFGEERASHVDHVAFERAAARPDAVLTLRYDDRAGLLAAGVCLDPRRDEVERRRDADPFRRDVGYATPPPGWRGARSGS